jgi:alpha-tubulin suppressor-like RCC1 family protein
MNTSGNLGDYTIYTNIVKKSVTGDTWNSVSTNLDSTLFTKTDGSIWALGNNTYGALGTGNTVNTSSPVRIGLINTAVKVEVKNYSAGVIFK